MFFAFAIPASSDPSTIKGWDILSAIAQVEIAQCLAEGPDESFDSSCDGTLCLIVEQTDELRYWFSMENI